MNMLQAAAARIACVTALGALLASCGGSFEDVCWGECPADESMEESPEIRVIDGDTIEFGGDRWRLRGFDAPESDQTCLDADGMEWACGQAATEALGELVSAGTVSCTDSGQRSHDRIVGSCSAGGVFEHGTSNTHRRCVQGLTIRIACNA